jgi:hypothetical protein
MIDYMSHPPDSRTPVVHALAFIASMGLALGACDCSDSGTKSICQTSSAPAACGTSCAGGASCGSGTHCGPDETCTAECVPGDGRCGSGKSCDADGRCVSDTDADGGTGGGGGGGVGGGAGGGDGGGACQDVNVTADPVKPYIVFIIDRSGSMTEDYPYETDLDCDDADPSCDSRWNSVRDVLLGTDSGPLAGTGVIEQFQSLAYIGVVQYTGDGDGSGLDGPWPDLIETPAAVDNLSTIAMGYEVQGFGNPPANGDTPTGESVWTVLCHLDAPYDSGLGCDSYATNTEAPTGNQPADPDAPLLPAGRDPGAPVIFILATDGEPDSSVNPDPGFDSSGGRAARKMALDSVKEARLAGIPTYVIAVIEPNNDELTSHLEHVACEGGTGPTPTSEPTDDVNEPLCSLDGATASPGLIEAFDADALRTSLTEIVTSSIPCSFQLDGKVSDVEAARAQGQVTIDSASVPADETNGWWLLDDGSTFELRGTACDDFRASPGAALHATFPCSSGIIIIPI